MIEAGSVPAPTPTQSHRWRAAGLALVFSGIALLVVYPFVGHGWLLLLDWVSGPHVKTPLSFWGLEGGLTAAMPFQLAVVGASALIGGATVSWLAIAIFFPVGGLGVARLCPGSTTARVAAGLVYVLSPVVYERLWAGQIAYLLAFAVLPWAAASIVRCRNAPWPRNMRPAFWLILLIGFGPHFLFIGAVLLFTAAVFPAGRVRALTWAVIVIAVTCLGCAYLFAGSANRQASVAVGAADLAAYRTRGDPTFGVFVNVAAGYGFWRRQPPLPKDDIAGWPFLFGAMVIVASIGAWRTIRHPARARRLLMATLLPAAVVGYFLALGDQGPTGALFRWAFHHVPGFAVMREPQKFVVLVVLAVAVCFGQGVDALMTTTGTRRGKIVVGTGLLLLPIAYDPSLAGGLRHRLAPSQYPRSWAEADALMGSGPGRILALPWHEYLAYPFTQGRVVLNPVTVSFRRDVIAGDDPDLPGVNPSLDRSRYLKFLYRVGPETTAFGHLVAPLGVEWVVLAKTADWSAYGWLSAQADLQRVLDTPDLDVYKNLAAEPLGGRNASVALVDDWGQLVGSVSELEAADAAAIARRLAAGPVTLPANVPAPVPAPSSPPAPVRRPSRTRYVVPSGAGDAIVIPEVFDPTWSASGHPVREDGHGLVLSTAGTGQVVLSLGLWSRLRAAYLLSLVIPLALLVLTSWNRRPTVGDRGTA